MKPSHTYSAAGTYSVKLTVTDDGGATGDVTHDVTVVAPASGTVAAQDTFERSVSSGWGTADTGGAWTVVSGSSSFSVAGGVGRVAVVPSATREARLSSLSLTSAVTEVEVSADAAAAGGAASVSVLGRQVGSASYQARLRFDTNGAVRFYVVRSAGSDVVIGGSSQTLTSSYSPGDTIKVKFAVTGTSPTTVAAKAWLKSSAEPTSWQFETTDTEATLQAAGAVGLRIAVSSASTVPTTTFSVDNLTVTKLG